MGSDSVCSGLFWLAVLCEADMKLSSQWAKHDPNFDPCIKDNGESRAEGDCGCGIKKRHVHCNGCGYVKSIGDWDAPPMASYRLTSG